MRGNKRIVKDCWPHEDQLTEKKSSSMIVETMDFKINEAIASNLTCGLPIHWIQMSRNKYLCGWVKKIEKWKNTQATAEVLDIFIKVCYNWLWFLEIDSESEGKRSSLLK
jgi:hypothetical protein